MSTPPGSCMLTCENGNRVHAGSEVHVAFVDGLHDAVCRQDSLSSAGMGGEAAQFVLLSKAVSGTSAGPHCQVAAHTVQARQALVKLAGQGRQTGRLHGGCFGAGRQ